MLWRGFAAFGVTATHLGYSNVRAVKGCLLYNVYESQTSLLKDMTWLRNI